MCESRRFTGCGSKHIVQGSKFPQIDDEFRCYAYPSPSLRDEPTICLTAPCMYQKGVVTPFILPFQASGLDRACSTHMGIPKLFNSKQYALRTSWMSMHGLNSALLGLACPRKRRACRGLLPVQAPRPLLTSREHCMLYCDMSSTYITCDSFNIELFVDGCLQLDRFEVMPAPARGRCRLVPCSHFSFHWHS